MAIRKFYLENAAGERMALNAEAGIFLSEPAGLGFTLAPSYADLKRGFFLPVANDAEPQNAFAAKLTFYKGEPYRQYFNLVNWAAAGGQLLLVYVPFTGAEFFRQVDIAFFTKGELNAVGALEVPISLTYLTPWYERAPSTLDMQNGQENSIRYTYRYTDDLIYGTDSAAALSGVIHPGGHVPGSMVLRYNGGILNPRIRLTGNVSGKTHGLTVIEAGFDSSDILEFSTQYRDSHVYRIAADGTVTDLMDSLQVDPEPFWNIPTDEPCTINIESDTAFTGSAELLILYYYRSV